ncbi:MAG: hypothetical protein K2X48_03600 [Chitinophagaceae bacterium]|nr:hypothetical protein [Chitinophagaceae bacterium]
MKQLFFSAIVMAGILTLASCKKNREDNSIKNSDVKIGYEQAKKFFESNAPQYESFSFDASAGGTITTSKGTKINFPANAFKNAAGQTINGNVTVDVKDILSASDMLLGNRPTEANGQPLISFGEMTVKASQNGQPLQLRNDSARVQVPLAPNPNAAGGQFLREVPMWRGDSAVSYTLQGYDNENTSVTLTQTGYIPRGVNWNQNGNFATNNLNGTSTFKLDSLGQWRNCDALMSDPRPKTTVLGYFTNQWNPETSTSYMGSEPSMLFFKVKQQNTLIKLYNKIITSVPGKEGLLSYQNSFPVGIEGTFLAITFKGGKVYAEMKDVTVGSPAIGKTYYPVSFVLSEVSEAQLLSLIQQLNTK